MKTKTLNLVSAILLLVMSSNTYAQNLFTNDFSTSSETSFDATYLASKKVISNFGIDEIPEVLDPFNFIEAGNPETLEALGTLDVHDPETSAIFPINKLALGAGFGFNSDQTLWCFHAAYLMRLALYQKAALYGSLGVVYNGSSTDFFTASLIDFQLKMLMFHSITRYNQVRFLYGALLSYALGVDKFKSGGKTDITRLTAGLVVGLYIILTTQLAIMVQTNIFAYQNQTLKPDSGGEFKDNSTWGLSNKNNLLALSLVWSLGNSNR